MGTEGFKGVFVIKNTQCSKRCSLEQVLSSLVCEQWTVQISLTLARYAVHENALDLACALELLVLACCLSLLSSFGPSAPF